jgi:hypothetical protein
MAPIKATCHALIRSCPSHSLHSNSLFNSKVSAPSVILTQVLVPVPFALHPGPVVTVVYQDAPSVACCPNDNYELSTRLVLRCFR